MNDCLALASLEIEEHVATSNRFFQLTHLTVDDLNVYAAPVADAYQVLSRLSHGSITDVQALEIMKKAAAEFKAIDDAIEAANAG